MYRQQPPSEIGTKLFGVVGILRGLLLKLWEPEEFKKLMLLQHHNDIRKKTWIWKENEQIVKLIRETWKLEKLFTAQEIFAVNIYKNFVPGLNILITQNYDSSFQRSVVFLKLIVLKWVMFGISVESFFVRQC